MSELKPIPRISELENHVAADDGQVVQQPNNKEVGGNVDNSNLNNQRLENLINTEKLRRNLFKATVIVALVLISLLYLMLIFLIYWLICKANQPNIFGSNEVWHIATILALPPTTILFFLIKTLSNNTEQSLNKENNLPANIKDMPVSEWLSQTMKILEGIVSAITGKK